MKIKRSLAFCVLAGSGVYTTSFAQAVAAPAPLAAAVDAAWQRAVQARSAEGELARARAGQVAAGALWAAPPSFEMSHRDDRPMHDAGRRESEVGIAWPLWLPGQRSARGTLADAEFAAAEAAQRAGRLRIAGEVREAAWTMVARQAERALAESQVSGLEALAADVQRRVDAGDLARADALAVRAELFAANAGAAEARQRLYAARSRWTLLTGLQPPLAEPVEAARGAPAEHPELALAALAIERARKRLDVVQVSRRDPPELAVKYRRDAPGSGLSEQNTLAVAIRVPFGTADRNLPRQAAALSEVDIAQAEEQRLRERLAAEIATARAAVQASENQLAAEHSRLALLRERAQLIDKSFRAGESPLPELLRALSAAAQADAGAARQRAELGLSRARLQQSQGILP